jgi:hypothetical protein
MMDEDECGAAGGMIAEETEILGGNLSHPGTALSTTNLI